MDNNHDNDTPATSIYDDDKDFLARFHRRSFSKGSRNGEIYHKRSASRGSKGTMHQDEHDSDDEITLPNHKRSFSRSKVDSVNKTTDDVILSSDRAKYDEGTINDGNEESMRTCRSLNDIQIIDHNYKPPSFHHPNDGKVNDEDLPIKSGAFRGYFKIWLFLLFFAAVSFIPLFFLWITTRDVKHDPNQADWNSFLTYLRGCSTLNIYLQGLFAFVLIMKKAILVVSERAPSFIRTSNAFYSFKKAYRYVSVVMWSFFSLLIVQVAREILTDSLKGNVEKILYILIIFGILLSMKVHLISNLAINFNSRNYLGRIRKALKIEDIFNNFFNNARRRYKWQKKHMKPHQFGRAAGEVHVTVEPVSSTPTTPTSITFGSDIPSLMPEDFSDDLDVDNQDDGHHYQPNQEILQYFMDLVHKDMNIYKLTGSFDEDKVSLLATNRTNSLFKYLGLSATSTIKYLDLIHYLDDKDAQILFQYSKKRLDFEHIASSLIRMLRERYRIGKNLTTMRGCVEHVDILLTTIFTLIAVIIGCLIFGLQLSDVLVPLSSTMIATTFIFGNTAMQTFNCIVFLFLVHPYDIGDRIYVPIENSTTLFYNLLVTDVHLLTTVFERTDGLKVFIPNVKMAEKMIVNVRRSDAFFTTHVVNVASSTPSTKFAEIRDRVQRFVEENHVAYHPSVVMHIETITSSAGRIELKLVLQSRRGYQNDNERQKLNTEFLVFLKDMLAEINVETSSVYNLNTRTIDE